MQSPIKSVRSDGVARLYDNKRTLCSVLSGRRSANMFVVKIRYRCCDDDLFALIAGEMREKCPTCISHEDTLKFRFGSINHKGITKYHDRLAD